MRVKHYVNEADNWYSCPASGECVDEQYDGDTTTCTCNAKQINNELDRLELTVARYKQMLDDEIMEHNQDLKEAHRAGWEQAKDEAIRRCESQERNMSEMSAAFYVAAMTYKEPNNDSI